MQEISGENAGQLGQQHLRFVRRGVCCCSAVARGPLLLPSPSLGVSSLDLGRSRKVSGPFSLPACRTWRRSRKTNNARRCAFLRSNFFSSAARLSAALLCFCRRVLFVGARGCSCVRKAAQTLFGRGRPIGSQFLERDSREPIGEDRELKREPVERGRPLVAAFVHVQRPVDLE